MPLEPKDILTFSFSAVTALIAIYNWRSGRRRAKLKDDLDILKKYRDEFGAIRSESPIDEDIRIVQLKRRIQSRMRTQYVLKGVDHSEFNAGMGLVAVALVTVGWAAVSGDLSLIKGWVLALVTVSGIGGFFFLLSALKDRNEEDALGLDQ